MRGFFRLLVAALLLAAGNAHAVYTIYLYESGGNVVASGSGSLNLTGMVLFGAGGSPGPLVNPTFASVNVGLTATATLYDGAAGPGSFGALFVTRAAIGAGDIVGMSGSFGRMSVPSGYVSGSPLASSSTWPGTTLAGLGATPGTYTWAWAGDSFVLRVGAAPPVPTVVAVPTLSEWGMVWLSMGLAGFALVRMRRHERLKRKR